jgi:hypothetical protein
MRRCIPDALRAASALVGVATAAAVVTALGFASPARTWLSFRFTGMPDEPAAAAGVFTHNASLLGAILALCVLVQALSGEQGAVARLARLGSDATVVALGAVNASLVGVTVGAYGAGGVRALLPHGPVELAGFSVALALYAAVRRDSSSFRQVGVLAGSAVGLLAVAAVLETYA